MPRTNPPCRQRSMKKVVSSDSRSNGWSRFGICTVLLYGLLLCIFVPDATEAAYTPPSNCTSVSWIYGTSKVQNISCAGQQLISVPKDGKEGSDVFMFDLSNNQIPSLAIDEFQYFANLQYLDVSYNQIPSIDVDTFSNLTSLKLLNLAANDLNYLPSGILSATSALTTFNLSRIENFTFGKRTSTSLLVLDLSYTNLASITKEHFQNLGNLEEVDLSHNNLTSLDRDLFKDHSSLHTINLSWNELTSLENDNVFKKCTSLATIDLSNNRIVHVHKDFLKDADPLTNLDLSNNLISSLDKSVFDDVRHLVTLHLNDNQLTSLLDNTFDNFAALTALYLNNNLLTTVPANLFDDLSALTTLYLNDNRLSSLPYDAFDGLTSVTTIYLNNNELRGIDVQLFETNSNLQYLYLSANSLSSVPENIWQYQTDLEVDISSNPFICNCDVRDYLYTLVYDPSKELQNIDSISCTDSSLTQHVYLDYNDVLSCTGYLGFTCTVTTECMVQEAKCDVGQCICTDNYYDTNGNTTDGGLCRDKVSLDYPCPGMDDACSGDHVICTEKNPSSSDTYCLCKPLYYDDNPQYLDGTCYAKVELGDPCVSVNNMCRPDNSVCGVTSSVCECITDYYDDNYVSVGGECHEKIDLHGSCNETYQCKPEYSECSNHTCECASGYYDFTDLGQCQEPSNYYSCSPDSTSSLHIVFSSVKVVASESECSQHCFEQDERYYHMEGAVVCICGSPSSSYRCCPMVTSTCDSKTYLGPSTLLAEAGINLTLVTRTIAGSPQSFTVSTTLPAIDQINAMFGDTVTVTTVNAASAVIQHTYTHSGLFWLTISACAATFGVCEDVSIPVKVQVPAENITAYLKGVAVSEVSSALSRNFSATFKLGYDIHYNWSRSYNGEVTKRRGCPAGTFQHRLSCIRLGSGLAAFDAAQAACSTSGSLLKIDFEVELSEIVNGLNLTSGAYLLGAQEVNELWQWEDSTKTFFSVDDLESATTGNCLTLDGNSARLTSASCTSPTNYICMSDPVSCPKGGELMSDGYCYVLASTESATPKSWTDANDYCNSNFGGWLTSITDASTQTTVTNLLINETVTEAWIGLHHSIGVYLWADNSVWDFKSPPYNPSITSRDGDCFVAASSGAWDSQDCSTIKDFVCQYSVNIQRKTVPSFILGNNNINIRQGGVLNPIIPTGTFSSVATDIFLFPGYAFSRSGNIQEWVFCSPDGAPGSHPIALQTWRPTCSVGTIVQAGCIPTVFASCSTGTHSCTPPTSCSDTETKFCYLSSTCIFKNETCTCNSVTSSGTGCGTFGNVPSYELESQTMVTITETGQKCYKVSDGGDKAVQEGDIIGLQFPSGSNIVNCADNSTDSEQQTLYSATASSWLVKPDTFPGSYSSIERTCDLQVVYTQESEEPLPESLGYTTSVGDYVLLISLENETASKQLSVSVGESIGDLVWVHPVLGIASSSSDSFGTINTELNHIYNLTFAAGRGTDLMSQFNSSAFLPFSSSCSPVVAATVVDGCNSTKYWSENPFTTYLYNTSIVGTGIMEVNVVNALGSTKKSLIIRTEVGINNASIELVTPARISRNVAINSSTQFNLSIATGTGVTYSFTVGGSPVPSTGGSLFFTFTSVGTFNVEGSVENILSTESDSITVFAKVLANLRNCQIFDSDIPLVAAVGYNFEITLQCDANPGSEVNAVWMLNDRTSNITGAISLVSLSPVWFTESVTVGSVSTVNFTVCAQDPFTAVYVVGSVNVYNPVSLDSLISNSTDIVRNETVQFTGIVSSSPGDYGTVTYNFDFGDGNHESSISGVVIHSYSSGGNYTVNVTASNGPSADTISIFIVVYEEVTQLKLTYNGPNEKSSPVTFTASFTSGNFLLFTFVSSPSAINITQSSPVYMHTFSSSNDYNVTVIAFNKQSAQSDSLIAHVMEAGDITISGFKVDGNAASLSDCLETLIARNYTAEVIHYSLHNVVCDVDFGDGTTQTDTSCSKMYAYPSAGNFTVRATAKYKIQNAKASITREICLQERIYSPSISIASTVGLPPSGRITKNVTVVVVKGDPLSYQWSTNATGGASTSALYPVEFTSEGTYYISVTVANEINSLLETTTVHVIEEISGMEILCTPCIQKNGHFFVRKNATITFTVTMYTGNALNASYSWDFGDSTSASGESNIHLYLAVGTYNLTINGSNAVSSQITVATIHVETEILYVTVQDYLWDWLTDKVNASVKNLNIELQGKFKATVTPPCMDCVYWWSYDIGASQETTTTPFGNYNYGTTGHKSLSVTAGNSLGNVTSSKFEFYVIGQLNRSYIEVTGDGNLLSGTSESDTSKVASGELATFHVASSEIVPNTVLYFLRLRKKSGTTWVLERATTDYTVNYLLFNFTESAVYALEASIENSLGPSIVTVYIEAIRMPSEPYINALHGVGGNITLGSSLGLSGGAAVGQYLTFNWFYAAAPSGETLSYTTSTVTITPGAVGQYIVTLEISNPVSSALSVNYTINVMIGVADVGINVALPFPGAVEVGSSVSLNGIFSNGTDLSFYWDVKLAGSSLKTGITQNFTVMFNSQGKYNVTLLIENYASSGTAFIVIFSRYSIPLFSIRGSGVTFVSNINRYVAKTNDTITFLSDISDTNFIDFHWRVDGSSEGTNETFLKTFMGAAEHFVQLNASNLIGSETGNMTVLAQDDVVDFTVKSCVGTYEIGFFITLTASYTSGTDVSVLWSAEQLKNTTIGNAITVHYHAEGNYSVNVTGSNYVSQVTKFCWITIQGKVDNLILFVSQYRFVNYTITFDVTGDYVQHATITWTFSHGVTRTTSTTTLDQKFDAKGTFTLEVTVANDVSSSTANVTFNVGELACSEPIVLLDKTNPVARRSSIVDFSVSVLTNGCTNYSSVMIWNLYFGSCSATNPNGTLVPLPSSVKTNLPMLQLRRNTLDYWTYCVVFEHRFNNTPVEQYMSFNLTIVESPITAVLTGGHSIGASEGTSLTVNASESYDQDEVPGTDLQFNWTCNQTVGTSTGLCAQVNALNSSSATFTGLNLTEGEKYEIRVTVSAIGRTSGSTSQLITIESQTTPIVSIKCVSCDAYGHFYLTSSRSVAFKGLCISNCNGAITYQWIVIDAVTNVALTIDSSQTSTGTSQETFVLKHSNIQSGRAYTFRIEVTVDSKTGSAEITLSPSSKPSAGNCSITPSGSYIPLSQTLKYSCSDVTDSDPYSAVNYKVLIISTSFYAEPVVAYYGPKAENEIFLVAFPGTGSDSVIVEIRAVNDFGAENDGYQRTISFTTETLTRNQTNKLDYLVDQMISIMRTVVKLNDPAKLRQFLLASLGYLNDLSLNNIGTPAQRKAIRDVIIKAISGLPMFSVYDIKQMASALSYLVSYTEEISLDTINKALNEIDAIKQQWESEGISQGADQREYDSSVAMDVIGTLNEALMSLSAVTSDSHVLDIFGDLNDYVLEVSSASPTPTNLSTKEQVESMIIQVMEFSTDLMLIPLKAALPNEKAQQKSGAGYECFAQHVSIDKINEKLNSQLFGARVQISGDILTSFSSYSKGSVLQLLFVSNISQYNFGNSYRPVNTVNLATSFHDPDGNSVSVNNLPAGEEVCMYLFSKDASTIFDVNDYGLQYSTGYNPLALMKYSNKTIEAGIVAIDLNMTVGAGVGVHVQVRANFTNSASGSSLEAVLYKNGDVFGSPKTGINKAMMDNITHNHLDYTFFIDPAESESGAAFQLRIQVNERTRILIGQYYSTCDYFDESTLKWDRSGCSPTNESIATVVKCKCNHMTSFGGSLFVSPDQLDFTDLSKIDIVSNPVAIITCSVIIGLYIVMVIAFRRMDLMDLKRISLIPLCGKDGSFKYEVTIVTGRLPGAGTSAHIGIRLHGEYGRSARQHITKAGAFQRNCSDTFIVAYDVNLGDLKKLQIWHDNSGLSPSWYLSHVIVNDLQTDNKYYFFGNTWLSLEKENGRIQKELRVAGAHEMSKFGHRFTTAVFNSLADKHLWLSLFNRPAQSRFTRVQRVTCCVTVLFTFVVVNAMWYGLLKKDNTELGFEGFGWEEVVLALVSNIMVLPVSVGLVFLFKKSRSKPNFLDHVQKPQTAQTLEIENLCENSQGGSFESSNTGAIPYDLERESTIDSVPPTTAALGLHRSRHVAKTHRENTDDSILQKRPTVAVTSASSKSPLWNEDGIMKWPDTVPTFDDGIDSRPSTGSTVVGAQAVRQPPKAGGSNPSGARKSKTLKKGEAGELLAELDKLENDLKESESRSVKSSGSKKSISLRKPTMHKSQWGSLEDILQSDDESVAESSGKIRKRGSTTSQSTSKKFNPREDPRINGNGKMWPKSRESVMSGTSAGSRGRAASGVTAGLRPGYYSEMTMESRDIKIPVHKEGCSLPPWCIYIGYIICFLLCVFSVIIVILYCFRFGSEESLKWVLALILSLLLSFLIIEPLKALLIAIYVVAMFKNVEQDEDADFIDIEPTFDNSNEKIKDVKFKPISGFALLQAQEEGRKIHRMNVMIRQFIAYLFYLWLIMVIVYVHFHYNSYLMTKHVENDFIAPTTSDHRNFTNITNIDEFWDWTENVFIDSLYKENLTQDEEHGLLLGEARMRLIRGKTAKCLAANAASGLGASSLTDRTCHGAGNYDEDTDNYAEGWNHSNSNFSWRHYTAGELGSTHKIGHVATYGGGGYPQGLGTSQAESDSLLWHLKDKGWIDLQTRAIIFEFALYSAGSDMTSLVALLAEFPLTGGVITSYEIQSQKLLWFQKRTVDPLMVLECILFIVVTYSVIHIALRIREQRKQFFKDLWNWYEMLTTLMAVVSIGMYLGCVIEATNAFNRFLDNQTGFTNFERAVYVHVGMRYLHAWLLFLLMFKVVKQLRFVKFMYVYERTLSKAVGHLLGTGLIYVILLLVYAQVGYLMYGQIVSGFESVGHAIPTLIVMIKGSFDFWPMLDYHPIFSHFYVYSYYSFAYGIMIALVISILTSTYKVIKSQMYYKATLEMQDYEMIDFMLKRFKLWAGMQKPKPAFRRVRFPGLPSVSSRSSSSYSNRSSSSLHSAESLTGPQFSEVQLRSMMARMAPTWQAVLRRMDKIVALDDEEESLVKRAENEMKNLNWKCRINELERQHKELLSWKNQPSTSGKPPAGESKQRQSILKRSGAAKDNQDRKAPATVSGATTRTAVSTPEENIDSQGRRPFSDQGVRVEQASTSKRRSSSTEKSKLQTFFKSIKPSKPAWNK